MAKTKPKNKKRKASKTKILSLSTARPVAAEDLRVGDGVSVAYATTQLLACEDPPPGQTHNRVLKADFIPHDAGDPLIVIGVCLPFVLTRNAAKQHLTLDVRRQHLVRLDPAYTCRAMKALGDKRSRSYR